MFPSLVDINVRFCSDLQFMVGPWYPGRGVIMEPYTLTSETYLRCSQHEDHRGELSPARDGTQRKTFLWKPNDVAFFNFPVTDNGWVISIFDGIFPHLTFLLPSCDQWKCHWWSLTCFSILIPVWPFHVCCAVSSTSVAASLKKTAKIIFLDFMFTGLHYIRQ